ncbi:MAG: redoxin domain-containing protein [Bacillota bacterium]
MDKKLKLGVVVVLLLIGIGLGVYYYQTDNQSQDKQPAAQQDNVGIKVSQIAPDFTLTNLKGEEVSLSDYRGQYVLLNFWATWCPPCRREIPDLNSFYEDNKEEFVLLAVDLGEPKEQVENFIDQGDYNFPVLLDETRKIGSKYNVSAIPTTYFINPQGEIKHIKKGAVTIEELNKIKEKIKN